MWSYLEIKADRGIIGLKHESKFIVCLDLT